MFWRPSITWINFRKVGRLNRTISSSSGLYIVPRFCGETDCPVIMVSGVLQKNEECVLQVSWRRRRH